MKPRTRTILRYTVFIAIALVTLAVLAGSWISFQGRREWAATKAELLGRGEKLSLVELAPPEIPDDQNFFADPLWAEVFARDENGAFFVPQKKRRLDVLREEIPASLKVDLDNVFKGSSFRPLDSAQRSLTASRAAHGLQLLDPARREKVSSLILETLAPLSSVLDDIEILLQRPDARAPISYELGFHARLDHIIYFLDISRAFSARALANLALDAPDVAARDVQAIFHLANVLRSEPIVISQLVREAVIQKALSAIDAGISMEAWTEETLVPIQAALTSARSIDSIPLALRGERGGANSIFENLRAGPNDKDNLFRQVAALSTESVPPSPLSPPEQAAYLAMFRPADQSFYNRTLQEWIDTIDKGRESGVDPAHLRDPAESLHTKPFAYQRFFLTIQSLFPLHATIVRFLRVQERVTLTLIACALERYRLKHRTYPQTLHELEPEFLTAIPRPVIAGQTFHYRRSGDTFQLWSNGWNQANEGGKAERNASNGDWIWGAW